MNNQVIDAIIEELESDRFFQITGAIGRGDRYRCAVGVVMEVASRYDGRFGMVACNCGCGTMIGYSDLPTLAQFLGIPVSWLSDMIVMNDTDHRTFAEIARDLRVRVEYERQPKLRPVPRKTALTPVIMLNHPATVVEAHDRELVLT